MYTTFLTGRSDSRRRIELITIAPMLWPMSVISHSSPSSPISLLRRCKNSAIAPCAPCSRLPVSNSSSVWKAMAVRRLRFCQALVPPASRNGMAAARTGNVASPIHALDFSMPERKSSPSRMFRSDALSARLRALRAALDSLPYEGPMFMS